MAQTHVDAPELLASWGFACFCGFPHAGGAGVHQQQEPQPANSNHQQTIRCCHNVHEIDLTWFASPRNWRGCFIWEPWWFKSLLLRRCSALTQPRTVSWRSPKLWQARLHMANSGKCWFKSINLHDMKGKKEKRLAKWRRERSCHWRVPWGVGQFYG